MADEDFLQGASPEELANRARDAEDEAQRIAAQINVQILADLSTDRKNSFWYSGDVAVITYTFPNTGELRMLTLTARGQIMIVFADAPDRSYRNGDAVEEAIRRDYTDADLVQGHAGTSGKIRQWMRNNWFQFGYEISKGEPAGEGRVYFSVMEGGDAFRNYDEAIRAGKDIIIDEERWPDFL